MRYALLLLLLLGCRVPGTLPFSPAAEAARSGDVGELRLLIARGVDPNAPSGENGWTPLLHAVHTNQTGTAAALIELGADVNRASPNGTTPLIMAAGYGNDAMVALLLSRGANPRLRTNDGDTAYDRALTGVTDLDSFTYFRCQATTMSLLAKTGAPAKPQSLRWASVKC